MSSLFKTVLMCALCLALSIALLPFLISTQSGSAWLSKKAGDLLGLKIQAQRIHLSWWGAQSIEQLHLDHPAEQILFSCPHITCDASLIQILLTRNWGHIALQEPSLHLSKPITPQRSERTSPKTTPTQAPAAFLIHSAHITLKEGSLSLETPDCEPVAFEQMNLLLHLHNAHSLQVSFSFNAFADQGHIAIEGSVQGQERQLSTTITRLSTQGLDAIAAWSAPSFSGLISPMLGSTLDLNATATVTPEQLAIQCHLESPQLHLSFSGASSGGLFVLNQPLHFHSELTDPLIASLSQILPQFHFLTLNRSSSIELQVDAFSCPLPLDLHHLSQSALQGTIKLGSPTKGTLHNQPFLIEALSATVHSTLLEKELSVEARCELRVQDHKGSLHLSGAVEEPLSQAPQGGFSLQANRFPLAFFDLSGAPLSLWLGNTVDIQASLSYREAQPQVSLSWSSERLTLPTTHFSGSQNPFIWTLIHPVSFQYQPPLEGILAPLKGTLHALQLPLSDYTHIQISADCHLAEISLGATERLRNIQTHVDVDTLNQITLSASHDLLTISATGSLDVANTQFTLIEPLIADCMVTPDRMPLLCAPTSIHVQIEPTSFDLQNLLQSPLKGEFLCAKALLQAHTTPLTVTQTRLPFEWNPRAQELHLTFKSLIGEAQNSIEGALTLCSTVPGETPSSSNAQVTGSLKTHALSTDLLGSLIGYRNLAGLIGSSLNASVQLRSTPERQQIALHCSSPLLHLESAFRIDSQGLSTEGKKQVLNWTLTPQAYLLLDQLLTSTPQTASFALKEQTTLNCQLLKALLPTHPCSHTGWTARLPRFALNPLEILFEGTIPSLSFVDTLSKEQIQLSALSITVHKQDPKTPLAIKLQSTSSTSDHPLGSIQCSCTVDPQTDVTGSLSIKALNFPSKVLDFIARTTGRTDFPFTTVLGNTFQLDCHTTLKQGTGPIELTLQAPRLQMDLAGRCSNGTLMLHRPLHAQVQCTKETSRLLLKELNLLDLSYLYAEAPITLLIPAEEVSIPLYSASIADLRIPRARLELGKVLCRNEGNIGATLALLKSRQFDQQGELSLWFAPCYFSVKQGQLSLDRSEILVANTFDICLFGNINLVKQDMDMKLGLTAQALHKAFGIRKLPEHYVLTIPMKGPKDHIKIDVGTATTKIALLIAWQQKALSGLFKKSPLGDLADELLGSAVMLPDSNAHVPPGKHPYPWEREEQKPLPSRSKKKAFKTTDKPLKQLMKMVK